MEPIEEVPERERRAPRRVLTPDVDQDVACAAAVHCPVLIYGSLSTAEWLARLIHERSARKDRPFIVFRLGERDDLRRLDTVLNGVGADRCTLFFTDMSRAGDDVQARLARLTSVSAALQEPRFRLIAGSSVSLFDLVERGKFDDVLFYRLNKIHIWLGSASAGRRDGLTNHSSERFEEAPGDGPRAAASDWFAIDGDDGCHLTRRPSDEHLVGAPEVGFREHGL